MEAEKRKYTTISLSHEVKRELESVGKMGQTHDELIKELVQIKKKAIAQNKNIITNDLFSLAAIPTTQKKKV
jgi:predicted CopG family antitoxin